MPSVCAAHGCTSTGGRDNVLFHNFPRKKEKAAQWIAAMKLSNFKPSRTTALCSKHFRDSDYHQSLSLMRAMGIPVKSARLRPGVVPSIFVHERSELLAPSAEFSKRRKDEFLSGDPTIGQTPGPSHCSGTYRDYFAAAPVHEAAPGLACESRQAAETLPEPACEPGHVADKSVQVRLLTCHEASQANGMKILSTSSTQTEPQAVSSGSLSFASLEHSSLASLGDRLHSCQQCTYVTLDKSTMNRHLQKHMGEPPSQCYLCPAAFACNSKLVIHVRTHTGERPFCCVHCNASFSRKDSLSDHMRTHTGERPFACVHCNASFSQKRFLVGHIRSHTGERPFSCVHCNASFLQKCHLVRHIRMHTGERPFSCVYCKSSFVVKAHLVEHMRIHTGERPFSCVLCNASFVQKSRLVIHTRIHTGERAFSCVHCNASFVNKRCLIEHIRTHTGERPFSCVHCNASFLRKNGLVMHIRTHTGERPLSCVHCNASFSRKQHLTNHLSLCHRNKNA
ncbi:gastrula zinc finger protein XlCGF57.1 isoform X5 [Rhipicephalus sanguineus]|uniref:gastrula zinc finger protein XlCGF57.1 isoform X5 n=1 Tax=Rhipicephalus sanguineus TaxID=34632 RepID=UPI0020C2DC35|nr:gastrula zinc finger protein XlCGF57.1 isoform X5 [Rhipicephalus sanguineus]